MCYNFYIFQHSDKDIKVTVLMCSNLSYYFLNRISGSGFTVKVKVFQLSPVRGYLKATILKAHFLPYLQDFVEM